MPRDVKTWDLMEFDDVQSFEDLYQNLAVFRYSDYLTEIANVLKCKEITRSVWDRNIIFEVKKRHISYCFELNDGARTSAVASQKLPLMLYSKKIKNELVLFFAGAEVNARVNYPETADSFVPLEFSEVWFTRKEKLREKFTRKLSA